MTTVANAQAGVNIDQAILVCVDRAKKLYPEERVRIEKGAAIALAGGVQMVEGANEALVSSQSGTRDYQVNGHCECPDGQYNAPHGRCKHRWAKALWCKAVKEVGVQAQYYAQYERPDGELVMGTATFTPRGYLFVGDDGSEPLYASMASLTLGGNVAIMADEQAENKDLVAKVCGY